MREAGDILAAIQAGTLPAQPEMVRLCDVLAGTAEGRRSPGDITLFKSLGMALEDVASASLILARAQERGLGTRFER